MAIIFIEKNKRMRQAETTHQTHLEAILFLFVGIDGMIVKRGVFVGSRERETERERESGTYTV